MNDSKEVFPEAGRELDALIAEQVMGIAPRRVRVRGTTDTVTIYTDNPYFNGDAIRESDIWHVEAKPYSTDIRAAWEVVEHLAKRRPVLEALSCVIGTNAMSGGRQNGCKFYPAWQGAGRSIFDAEPHDGWDAVAESIPRAICLAALKAVEVRPTTAETPQ